MADDEGEHPEREILSGIGALVATTLVIALVVGLAAFGAVRMLGLGEAAPRVSEEPSLYIPSGTPTTTPEGYPDPTGSPSAGEPSTTTTSSPAESKRPEPRKNRTISLQAFPVQVAPGERINLTGVYQAGEGATLQVQRFDGGWSDFPVTATVRGGIFETYVMTSRTGKVRFRVLDTASGRASDPVSVTVG